jgi:pimeloyl-ACP methyl ester carboxylesterase
MIFEHDGQTIDYELRGEGPTIVLVHGLSVDRRVMQEAFEPLLSKAGLRRLYLDLPGHGHSRGDATRASADTLVAALAALCRELLATTRDSDGKAHELEAPLIAGYSYGGYLALGLLRELGGARGLFLCCPVVEPDFARRRQSPRRVAHKDAELPFSDDPREAEAFVEVAVRMTRPVLETFQRVVHPANIATDQALLSSVRARYVLSRPFLDSFSRLEAPVAVVCGRDDHWAGWQDASDLVARFPRAAFTVVPDCGHLLPLEDAPAFARALDDWLRRLT